MLSRKQLQLFLCVQCTFYVFGEVNSNDLRAAVTIENFTEIPSVEYVEYTIITRDNDTYEQRSTNSVLETTDVVGEDFLTYDHTKDKYVGSLAHEWNNEISEENLDNTSIACDENDTQSISNLTVKSAGTEWIYLSWYPPCTTTITSFAYTVQVCIGEENCYSKIANSNEYNATDLVPCTEYIFIVTIDGDQKSNAVNISTTTSHNITSIGEIQDLNETVTMDTIELTWHAPEKYRTCVRDYSITQCLKVNCIKTIVSSPKYVARDLSPCTEYLFSITVVTETVYSVGVNISRKTLLQRPGLPQFPVAEASNFSFFIHWQPPKVGITCIKGYHVTVNPDTFTIYTNNTNVTIDGLHACIRYTIYISAVDESNANGLTANIQNETLPVVTKPPILREEPVASMHDILFTWEIPKDDNNCSLNTLTTVCNYTITHGRGYTTVNGEVTTNMENQIPSFSLIFKSVVENLSPYTTYACKAYVTNTAGISEFSNPINITTLEDVPSAPILHVVNITDFQFVFIWEAPNYLAGNLQEFEIKLIWNALYQVADWCTQKSLENTTNLNGSMFTYEYLEAKPFTNYTAWIRASTTVGWGNYSEPLVFQSKPGVPPQPDEDYINSITLDPYKARRSTTSAAVLLPLFPNTNGKILYYSIIVSERGYNPAANAKFNLETDKWPNVSSWEEAMQRDFTIPYQATRPCWHPDPTFIADYGHMRAVTYMLGEDETCKELSSVSSNSNKRLYCNGPLKPDTWYDVRMRAFTEGGYADSTAFVIKTNAEINVGMVIGIVFGILFLGVITTMMLLVRKCSLQVMLHRFLHSDMSGSPVPAPFTRKKFIAHCQQLVDNPGKLSNEFRLLQTLSVDLQMPTNSACLQANRKKNRYSDILPYDFSRVKLEVIDNDPNTDYINASFIRGYTREDEYIACQGPKEETTYDFWRMVDQYNVNVIIMLTQLIEKGKEKCHQYFPTIGETFRYENMTIRCSSELDYRTYTQRTLVLQKGNKKRNVMHLHFKDWPDHDVPEDFDPMIHFCQIMRRSILANKGFVIIHCSAGIGRTGTLIAIDILLQNLRDNRKMDVFGTVYRLRQHRINMVQRESQYVYIYNCIKQVLKNPYCFKTYKPPSVDPVHESTVEKPEVSPDVNTKSNSNLVDDLETLKIRNFFVSMDSIRPYYHIFPWSTKKRQISTMNNGLRYSKSTSAIDDEVGEASLEESGYLDCLTYDILPNSTNQSDSDNLNGDSRKETENSICKTLQNQLV